MYKCYWERDGDDCSRLYTSDGDKRLCSVYVKTFTNRWVADFPGLHIYDLELNVSCVEAAEWQATLFLHNDCLNHIRYYSRFRDSLPSLHELAEAARAATK